MKLYNRVQILNDGDVELRFNKRLASPVGVTPGVTLHGVALEPIEPTTDRDKRQRHSLVLILSPFPINTWRNLIRISITAPSRAGALFEILSKLKLLGLKSKHFETTNGTDLGRYRLYGTQEASRLASRDNDVIVPTVDMILEIPQDNTRKSKNDDLHKSLRKIIEYPDCPEAEKAAREKLQTSLKKEGEINCISPLRTLNRLGRDDNFVNTKSAVVDDGDLDMNSAVVDDGDVSTENFLFERRSRIREKILVTEDFANEQNPLSINVEPWSEPIWHRRKTIPDIFPAGSGDSRLALGYADAGEKLICWDIFEPRRSVLVAIDLLVPTGGNEHIWWEWALGQIRRANGNVLTCHTSARLDGDWGSLEAVILFPLEGPEQAGKQEKENEPKGREERPLDGQRKKILDCLRILQGHEGGSEEFKEFRKSIDQRFESTLHFKNWWDLRGFMKYSDDNPQLMENPFDFTNIFSMKRYKEIYVESDNSCLWKNAIRIRDGMIRHHVNTLVIGAPRAGKSTLLRIIEGLIEQDNSSWSPGCEELSLAVRARAGTAMPFRIFQLIIRELVNWVESDENINEKIKERDLDGIGEIGKYLMGEGGKESLSIVERITMTLNTGVVAAKVSFRESDLVRMRSRIEAFENLDLGQKSSLTLWEKGSLSSMQMADLVADYRDLLDLIIRNLKEALGCTLTLVVIVDEFERFSEFGDDHFVREWREVVEQENSNIVWLVSSVRTIDEESRLQPLSGVFREWTLGSLDRNDCQYLFDQFTGLERKRNTDFDDQSADHITYSDKRGLKAVERPVLTFLARGFIRKMTARLPYFMQVFLFHLFEHAATLILPVINRRTCEKVLFSRVLPELSDYLARQWKCLPDDVQREIEQVLFQNFSAPRSFVRSFGRHSSRAYPESLEEWKLTTGVHPEEILQPDHFSARACLVLQRAGLSCGEKTIIAPLAAVWLLERRLREDEEARLYRARRVTDSKSPLSTYDP